LGGTLLDGGLDGSLGLWDLLDNLLDNWLLDNLSNSWLRDNLLLDNFLNNWGLDNFLNNSFLDNGWLVDNFLNNSFLDNTWGLDNGSCGLSVNDVTSGNNGVSGDVSWCDWGTDNSGVDVGI